MKLLVKIGSNNTSKERSMTIKAFVKIVHSEEVRQVCCSTTCGMSAWKYRYTALCFAREASNCSAAAGDTWRTN
jgi:hypothetical protein